MIFFFRLAVEGLRLKASGAVNVGFPHLGIALFCQRVGLKVFLRRGFRVF